MGGKNRATSSCLNPGGEPTRAEQNTLGSSSFRMFVPVTFSPSQSCCTGWHQRAAKRRNYPWTPIRLRKQFVSGLTPAWGFR